MDDPPVAAASNRADGRRAPFCALLERFEDACVSTGERHVRRIDVAGRTIEIQFSSAVLERTMFRGLAHIESTATDAPALTIAAWDTETSGVALPVSPAELETYMEGGLPSSVPVDGVLASLGRPNPGVSMLELATGRAVYVIPDANRVPHPDLSGPFVTILNWWSTRQGLLWLHAAAIGDGGDGVLIIGRGGSGKSTTSLACVSAGMEYAGDDYCIVEPETLTALSVSNGGKLALHAIGRLPNLRPHIINPQSIERHKGVIYLWEVFPDGVRRSLKLRGIVFPVRKGVAVGAIRPMTPGESLRELAPSSLLQLSAGEAPSLRRMADLVKRLPSYALELPEDITRVPDLVRRAIAGEA
ncbi:MAG: hypothetical protein ACSLFM_02945 [Tepidiformaceae bacterium]